MQGTKVQSLLGELKSHMLHSEAKRNKIKLFLANHTGKKSTALELQSHLRLPVSLRGL